MKANTIQTRGRVEVGDSLYRLLQEEVPPLKEACVLAITSKIVSVCEGRVVPKNAVSKENLIRQEAEWLLQSDQPSPYGLVLTIKQGCLIPSAGIDESNANDSYILYPRNVQRTAEWIWAFLKKRDHLAHLGILITDSHTTPLRRGVTGIALAWCGFHPLLSYMGQPDLYGKPLRVTQAQLLDGLAATAVLLMGEGNERTPLVILEDLPPSVIFMDRPPSSEEKSQLEISPQEDLYGPLLSAALWEKGGALLGSREPLSAPEEEIFESQK